MWRQHELKDRYDVVIIGGGVHGLATAYYLTQMGVRDVAVLEAKYIGFGGSGRNTAIVRSNYRTPEGIAFYNKSVQLYEQLAADNFQAGNLPLLLKTKDRSSGVPPKAVHIEITYPAVREREHCIRRLADDHEVPSQTAVRRDQKLR